MHGIGTLQSTLQALLVPACIRNKARDPRRKVECTHARMMGKSPNIQFRIQFSTWNVGSLLRKWNEISETWKDIVLIFAGCRKWSGKYMGLKWLEIVLNFLGVLGCKAENCVIIIGTNCLIGKFVGVERFYDRVMKVNIVNGDVVWQVVSCYCSWACRSVN